MHSVIPNTAPESIRIPHSRHCLLPLNTSPPTSLSFILSLVQHSPLQITHSSLCVFPSLSFHSPSRAILNLLFPPSCPPFQYSVHQPVCSSPFASQFSHHTDSLPVTASRSHLRHLYSFQISCPSHCHTDVIFSYIPCLFLSHPHSLFISFSSSLTCFLPTRTFFPLQ